MKQTFDRLSTLPSFRCDTQSLELLVKELLAEFGSNSTRWWVKIERKGESIEFESFEDIRQFKPLPPQVRDFSIVILGDVGSDNSYHLYSSLGGKARATATGSSKAWCIGLVGISLAFARQHKSWHAFLSPGLLWLILLTTFLIPALLSSLGYKLINSREVAVVYLLVQVLLGYMIIRQDRLFPSGTMIIRNEDNWLRRYNGEITAITTVVATIVAVITALLAS